MTTVNHDRNAHQFTAEVDGYRCVLDYTITDRSMTITHTGVPQPIAGRGIAAQLMQAAVSAARQEGWTIVPACSYAAAYLRRRLG